MFRFDKTEEGMALLAAFVGGLVKAGLTYEVDSTQDEMAVTLTGGY